MSVNSKTHELKQRMQLVLQGGGEKAVEKHKAIGKLTARERILELLDEGSFHEYDLFVQHSGRDFDMDKKILPGDGVVTGTGTINGYPVCIYAQDFTVAGGSLGFMHAKKICKIMDHAMKLKTPIIGINDSGGARIQEGVNALSGYGDIFYRNTMASGVIPQISVILGPCAGGAVYSPALTDFVFVVDKISKMFITGPDVIKTVLGEEISQEDLGGARVHAEVAGNAHFFAESEQECFDQIKNLFTYIPWNNDKKAEPFPAKKPRSKEYKISSVFPSDPAKPYDVRHIIKSIVDNSEFLEVQELFAPNIVIGFARINGETVGFVANQPIALAGVLDCNSSDKAARFIRFCDAFNIPLVTLVDVPGFLCGTGQEYNGIITNGAKLLFAYGEATVPKITITLRKSYGGAHDVMSSKQLRGDINYAWPSAEIAVMGASGAAAILYGSELKKIEDPEAKAKFVAEKEAEYTAKFATPYEAAKYGHIDDVIEPRNTRFRVIRALQALATKKDQNPMKKHCNIPL